jgi:hypothetical protein
MRNFDNLIQALHELAPVSEKQAGVTIPEDPAKANPLFPASGPATRSFNGLHPKSKFLAFKSVPWLALSVVLLTGTQTASAVSLLLLGSEGGSDSIGATNGFVATGKFSSVTYVDTTNAVPALALLMNYDAIFAWTDYPPAPGLGDVLADYYDLGGKSLTLATYAFSSPWGISGRVLTGNYAAFFAAGNGTVSGAVVAVVADPIFNGVNLAGVSFAHNSNYSHPDIAPGATLLATDGFGVAMIARSSNGVVNMNMWPSGGSSDYFLLAANSLVSVPEPSSTLTFGLLAACCVGLRRRATR